MRKLQKVTTVAAIGLVMAGSALAQPGPRDHRGGPYPPPQPQYQGPAPGGRYYYNGRWIDQNEWQRHSAERDRWAHNYQRRRGHDDNGAAIVAGILGFALGAAIVGSQQQAEHARTADAQWDAYCARKYRSYDRRSRTYLGSDGLRHYCQ